ncbi:tRNA uridine-5-carboxymethylaminomethyl(34) synthesis GTPase MnmE [Megasphaera vaginalis (ex Srinivasan et al. 2021)]|uniref:tRNA modification GTPase MnmE n=1 Tax=Megasphaera vaginalis (ex Srinivasan et al. 2021) TaxID=1111454 RepID=U7UH74_9FIRM|nr:tRNA uridine-5-carboxymethylaminomethyl(34) synthesis GTPase MnmE [Megasphaera vaginalis (ex Srinivasan et al. 2021)]ERT58641.1 tRNA modification GTPase TrmE [Megasphaera vaginalis (ex Srinivasan et al. 2021)]
MYDPDDTIAAIATPPGQSGIGVIRVSGSRSFALTDGVFHSASSIPLEKRRDRSVQYGTIVDETGTVIDEVLLLLMHGPHSYTAEDVVEIQCHGGGQSLQAIMGLLLRSGVRLAAPGEFTQRAFINGRIDLAQAEAVMDVIQSKSAAGLNCAVTQLEGRLSGLIGELRKELADFMTRIEVMIDYPEEDLEEVAITDIGAGLREMEEKIEVMLQKSESGRMIRDGITVAIAGVPNAGKSSLLNRLLAEERAIVTDVPGTTRDSLEEWATLNGIPLRLVDTAGIHETDDKVERIGIDRARQYLDKADINLVVIDSARPLSAADREILIAAGKKRAVIALNKADLAAQVTAADLAAFPYPVIAVSAKDGTGLEALAAHLTGIVREEGLHEGTSALLTNTRHIELVRQSREALRRARQTIDSSMPVDCAIVDIREAWERLGSITGDTVADDIAAEIFSRFCLGK